MTTLWIIIYVVGYALAYYLLRKEERKRAYTNHEYDYGDVFINILVALSSWLWVIIVIILSMPLHKKPPKWL